MLPQIGFDDLKDLSYHSLENSSLKSSKQGTPLSVLSNYVQKSSPRKPPIIYYANVKKCLEKSACMQNCLQSDYIIFSVWFCLLNIWCEVSYSLRKPLPNTWEYP